MFHLVLLCWCLAAAVVNSSDEPAWPKVRKTKTFIDDGKQTYETDSDTGMLGAEYAADPSVITTSPDVGGRVGEEEAPEATKFGLDKRNKRQRRRRQPPMRPRWSLGPGYHGHYGGPRRPYRGCRRRGGYHWDRHNYWDQHCGWPRYYENYFWSNDRLDRSYMYMVWRMFKFDF